MRAITFRAWDKRSNRMCPVADISFGHDGAALTIMAYLAPRMNDTISGSIIHGESGVLMQATGLKDCTGQEIYESDLVRLDGNVYEVYWNEDRWGLKGMPEPGTGSRWDYDNGDYYRGDEINWNECALVGNIYEHPQFLEPCS